MNNINPVALVLWTFCTLIGYLIGDQRGAVAGLSLGLGLSLINEIIGDKP